MEHCNQWAIADFGTKYIGKAVSINEQDEVLGARNAVSEIAFHCCQKLSLQLVSVAMPSMAQRFE